MIGGFVSFAQHLVLLIRLTNLRRYIVNILPMMLEQLDSHYCAGPKRSVHLNTVKTLSPNKQNTLEKCSMNFCQTINAVL